MKTSKEIRAIFEKLDVEWNCQKELFPSSMIELTLYGKEIATVLEALSCLESQYREIEPLERHTNEE